MKKSPKKISIYRVPSYTMAINMAGMSGEIGGV